MSKLTRTLSTLTAAGWLTAAALGTLAGCESAAPTAESSDDLTSNTARARSLTFTGSVYVPASASESDILAAVKQQTQSAFGAFRNAKVGVNSRELGDIDKKTFVKTPVEAFDVSKPGSAAVKMLRVAYTYRDNAIVPVAMAKRSSLSLGLLHGSLWGKSDKIIKECTANDKEAQDFASSIWYVFDPSLSSCKTAMAAEQKVIDADRAKLPAPKVGATTAQVPLSETQRLYMAMTAALTGDKTNKSASYPEYDKLWTGGVKKGRVVIGLVGGLLAEWESGSSHDPTEDEGYGEYFRQMREVFKARPGFKLTKVDPPADFSSYDIGGTKITGVTFDDAMKWELDNTGWPANLPASKQHDLKLAVANKLLQHWMTFEKTVTVQIGKGAPQQVTIEINSYFGAGSNSAPHKQAIKNSDVFIYNGHSYIGYGPLDPKNFTSADFPTSYQIFFIDSCVSYNYYEKDYFPKKSGATANLELITNGMETWTTGSGAALGKFLAALLDGKQQSYSALLKAAEIPFAYDWGGDALRVVDGELDNVYSPSKTPIVVK